MLLRLDDVHSQMTAHCPVNYTNDFCSLAFHVRNLPGILFGGESILNRARRDHSLPGEAAEFLLAAQTELTSILRFNPKEGCGTPIRSHQLRVESSQSQQVYPKRIDIHISIVQGTVFIVWLLVQIKLLSCMAKVARLATSQSFNEDSEMQSEALKYENAIRELVDDICASVPYFLRPKDPESLLKYFPHSPGTISVPINPGPELISSMSQLMLPLYRASEVEYAPRSQRQWLQQYMTVLTRDPENFQRAQRLELDNGMCFRHDSAFISC